MVRLQAPDELGALVEVLDPPLGGGEGPLAGLTVGVKELIAVAGLPRRSGAGDLVDLTPQPVSAPAVQRLIAAGAAVVATTATHPLAYGTITPQTRNPRAPDRIAGGSSGGSAAAVAAGMVDVGLGSDTGGSVRIPAACCGVVGLKTTFGLVPVEGVQPLAPSLDTVGPITRDVATCAAVQRVLADRPAEPAGPVRRVGVVPEVEELVVDADVRDVWRTVLAALEADGAELVEVPLPLAEVNRVTDTLLDAEAYAVHEALLTRRPGPDGWAPDVWKRLGAAKALASADVSAARTAGERWRERVRSVFDEVEVLVLPVLALRTPPRDPSRRRRISRTLLTNPWNLAGVPAGAVPAGVDYGGAPVGLQVVGPWDGEELVLAGMAAIERLRAAGTTPGSPPAS